MFGKLLVFSLLLQSAVLQQIAEEELNADAKYLNMSARGLKDILDLGAFTNLEVADFSNNAIARLDWERLAADAPLLKSLNLAGNLQLTLPETGSSVDLALSVLNMSECNVEIIGRHALDGLKSLEVLDLRENPIAFEQSPVFEALEAPPKVLIVSKLSKRERRYVCQHVDMQLRIIDDDMHFECKDVRRNDAGAVRAAPNREKVSPDIMVDDLLLTDTHMEQEMAADQPDDGSGDADDAPLAGDASKDEEVNQDAAVNVSEDIADGDEAKPEEGAEPSDEEITEHASDEQSSEETTTEHVTDAQPSDEDTSEASEPEVHDIPEPAVDSTESTNDGDEQDKHKGQITAQMVNPDSAGKHSSHEHHHHHEPEAAAPGEDVIQAKQPMIKATEAKAIPVDISLPSGASEAPLGETKSADCSSTGKNVILVLVIGAVVMGSVFGLMKVYKDRQENAAAYEEAKGSEMVEMSPERKPLMNSSQFLGGASDAADGACTEVSVGDTVGEPAEKTAMEIFANVPNSGLPDIDDPSRLSTIIVSTTNLSEAK